MEMEEREAGEEEEVEDSIVADEVVQPGDEHEEDAGGEDADVEMEDEHEHEAEAEYEDEVHDNRVRVHSFSLSVYMFLRITLPIRLPHNPSSPLPAEHSGTS